LIVIEREEKSGDLKSKLLFALNVYGLIMIDERVLSKIIVICNGFSEGVLDWV
jgi:hypothetical protein